MVTPVIFIIFLSACAGACLGSFASATVWAWLHEERIPLYRSSCDKCGKALRIRDLLPIASFCMLGGKCSFCGARIPRFHFYMELVCAITCAIIGASYQVQWLSVVLMLLSTALIAASACDLASKLLPDFLTIGCICFIPILVFLRNDLTPADALIGYIGGGLFPLSLFAIFKVLRKKECLGLGDVKLFALGGGLLGWQILPCIFFIASTTGIICFFLIHFIGQKSTKPLWQEELPFGPFISGAILLCLIFPGIPVFFYSLFY